MYVITPVKTAAINKYIISNNSIVKTSFLLPVFVSSQLLLILSSIFSSPTAVSGRVKISLRFR